MTRWIATILALALPLQAHAAFECNVKIKHVLVYVDGSVNVYHTGRNDYTYICNLNVDRLGASPATCAMWTTMLQHIKKNNYWANIYFNGTGSCATLPVYGDSPAPVYIGNMDFP